MYCLFIHVHILPFEQEPKWKIAIKCTLQLIFGVGLVTLFSDPMVDALTDLTNPGYKGRNGSHIPIGSKPFKLIGNHLATVFTIAFYVSFVVTPLCSNASELVSSLIFASKKMKVNSSMTYSQVKSSIQYDDIMP